MDVSRSWGLASLMQALRGIQSLKTKQASFYPRLFEWGGYHTGRRRPRRGTAQNLPDWGLESLNLEIIEDRSGEKIRSKGLASAGWGG
jgi:hypothetical protein